MSFDQKKLAACDREELLKLARTITPGHNIQHEFAKAEVVTSLDKAAHPITSQFFSQPEVSVQHLTTEQLITSLAGEGDGRLNTAFRDGLRALYPTYPGMWDIPKPSAMVGNMASRQLDSMNVNAGGQYMPEPLKALSLVLEANAMARALKKAATSNDPEGELEKWRREQVKLMPIEVQKAYAEMNA